jgi:hypothetical protein
VYICGVFVDHCSISRIVAIRNCCFLLDYFKEVRRRRDLLFE